ncbi:MAG TPA: VOC family protein [bacterium]|nr:VOC family protein [bacterium]
MEIRVCIDVPEMDAALRFYVEGLGLTAGRRFDPKWAELLGASAPIDLLVKEEASPPFAGAAEQRDYRRHWTPTHLDFVVPDIEAAVKRAEAFGGRFEREVLGQAYGRLALMSDPFGNGFCFLEFKGKGYDEIKALP